MKPIIKLSALVIAIIFLSFKNNTTSTNNITTQESSWTTLFNGEDLTGWDTYLGMPYIEGQNSSNQNSSSFHKPFGLNNDPLQVFSVVEVDGQPAIRISGEVFGGISTVKEYENYHLQLEFKWGTLKFAPRLNALRDSGVLYHGIGDQGAEAGFWLRSQEFQVQESDCGDYWGVGGGQVDIRTTMRADSLYQYDPNGRLRHFGDVSEFGRNAKKYPDNENPTGQWNTLDLYCYGSTSAHVVNGVVTMILENSRMVIDNIENPLTKGKIQIQTEGAEIYYRNIKIKPISAFPTQF